MTQVQFAHIGMNHLIQVNRVIAVIPPQLETGRKYLKIAKSRGSYIDGSRGRPTRSMLLLDDGTVVTSALNVKTIYKRFSIDQEDFTPDYKTSDTEDMLSEDILETDEDEE